MERINMKYVASRHGTTVQIHQEPIELYKILKLGNLVRSGGEAKFVIAEGLVRLNGAVETRKRKKVVAGDSIEFEKNLIRIVLE